MSSGKMSDYGNDSAAASGHADKSGLGRTNSLKASEAFCSVIFLVFVLGVVLVPFVFAIFCPGGHSSPVVAITIGKVQTWMMAITASLGLLATACYVLKDFAKPAEPVERTECSQRARADSLLPLQTDLRDFCASKSLPGSTQETGKESRVVEPEILAVQNSLAGLEKRRSRLLAAEICLRLSLSACNSKTQAKRDYFCACLRAMHQQELTSLLSGLQQKMTELDQAYLSLQISEQNEMQGGLQVAQDSSIQEFLRQQRLDECPVIGLRDEARAALIAAGIDSAQKLTPELLEKAGICGVELRAIASWKNFVCRQAELRMPTSLQAGLRLKLKSKYLLLRRNLEEEMIETRGRLHRGPAEINELYAIASTRLETLMQEPTKIAMAIAAKRQELRLQIVEIEKTIQIIEHQLKQLQGASAQYDSHVIPAWLASVAEPATKGAS